MVPDPEICALGVPHEDPPPRDNGAINDGIPRFSNLEFQFPTAPSELPSTQEPSSWLTLICILLSSALRKWRSTAGHIEHSGSEAPVVDEGGGRAVYLDMDFHARQHSRDQASVADASTANLNVVQQVLSAISGGLVILSIESLHGTSMGDYPEFIKLGLFVACVLLIMVTFLGLMIKEMGKIAVRVVAGMSITAMTIAAVYQVSENVYIKCIIAVMGAIATMVMGLINWR